MVNQTTKIYRVGSNKWNIENPPWRDAIAIEEVELRPDGSEIYAVPPVVCWLTRGTDQMLATKIVEALNV